MFIIKINIYDALCLLEHNLYNNMKVIEIINSEISIF